MAAEPNKSSLELSIDLVKGLAWPLFAFVVLVSFWRPFHETADLLPDIVNRSNAITIGNLTLIIDRNLRGQGNAPKPEVRQVLAQLSPDGIRTLMSLNISVYYNSDGANSARSEYAELVKLGLVEEVPKEEMNQGGGSLGYGVKITPLGKDTQTFLYALISEFTQQVNQSQPTATPQL